MPSSDQDIHRRETDRRTRDKKSRKKQSHHTENFKSSTPPSRPQAAHPRRTQWQPNWCNGALRWESSPRQWIRDPDARGMTYTGPLRENHRAASIQTQPRTCRSCPVETEDHARTTKWGEARAQQTGPTLSERHQRTAEAIRLVSGLLGWTYEQLRHDRRRRTAHYSTPQREFHATCPCAV